MKHIKHVFDQRPGADPLGGLRGRGQKVNIQLFSEHGHVAFQIKGK